MSDPYVRSAFLNLPLAVFGIGWFLPYFYVAFISQAPGSIFRDSRFLVSSSDPLFLTELKPISI